LLMRALCPVYPYSLAYVHHKPQVAERQLRRELLRQRRASTTTSGVFTSVNKQITLLQQRIAAAQRALLHVNQLAVVSLD